MNGCLSTSLLFKGPPFTTVSFLRHKGGLTGAAFSVLLLLIVDAPPIPAPRLIEIHPTRGHSCDRVRLVGSKSNHPPRRSSNDATTPSFVLSLSPSPLPSIYPAIIHPFIHQSFNLFIYKAIYPFIICQLSQPVINPSICH